MLVHVLMFSFVLLLLCNSFNTVITIASLIAISEGTSSGKLCSQQPVVVI